MFLKRSNYGYCPLCHKLVRTLTKDHIVPRSLIAKAHREKVSLKGVLGRKNAKIFGQWIPNIRMICERCNTKRGDKLFDHPLINEVLKRFKERNPPL